MLAVERGRGIYLLNRTPETPIDVSSGSSCGKGNVFLEERGSVGASPALTSTHAAKILAHTTAHAAPPPSSLAPPRRPQRRPRLFPRPHLRLPGVVDRCHSNPRLSHSLSLYISVVVVAVHPRRAHRPLMIMRIPSTPARLRPHRYLHTSLDTDNTPLPSPVVRHWSPYQ